MKYNFYNPVTGVGWEDDLTYLKKKRFLQNSPWIRELRGIFMSGIYNQTYFDNHPFEGERDGVLYGVILVNKKTWHRECIKVGIASGKDYRHIIKRSHGFKGYEIRIQRTYHDTLYNVWKIEQDLHEKYKHESFVPKIKFGGYTECFKIDSLILRDFPKNSS
tara:strand:- start:214 stop:699 length:486 start_codon:yes stop_codon:yes gene_type:complete